MTCTSTCSHYCCVYNVDLLHSCESYNTIQRQLLNGSTDVTHAEGRGVPGRNPSQRGATGRSGSSESWSLSQSYDGPGLGRFSGQLQPPSGFPSSYRHSSGQSISPRVTNYFSLSRQQNSDPYSQSHSRARSDSVDTGSFRFWGNINLKETLGLIGSSEANAEASDVEEEDEDEDSHDDTEEEEEEDEDDDEDDGSDDIDIFGHR